MELGSEVEIGVETDVKIDVEIDITIGIATLTTNRLINVGIRETIVGGEICQVVAIVKVVIFVHA